MIRVVIADDQAVVRGGLRMILEAQDDIEVVGEAEDGDRALELAASLDPDVIVMDIRMPVLDGIKATRRLAEAGARARVLVLTTYGLDENVYAALRAGASGFLVKTDSPRQLVQAVRGIAAGDILLGPDTTSRLIEHFLSGPAPGTAALAAIDRLTERERDVLKLIAVGLSNAEISSRLHISEGTVKTHIARILMKLHCRDRIQLIVLSYETGLVRPGQKPQ